MLIAFVFVLCSLLFMYICSCIPENRETYAYTHVCVCIYIDIYIYI